MIDGDTTLAQLAACLKQFPADTTLEVHRGKQGWVAELRSVIYLPGGVTARRGNRESIADGLTLQAAIDRAVVAHITTLLMADDADIVRRLGHQS